MLMHTSLARKPFRRALICLAIVGLLLAAAPGAYANVRTGGGGDLPVYARIASTELYHTDDWAVIVFYRPPTCVPAEFNLLEMYDFENAFGCTPPTTDGFILWEHGTEVGVAPRRIQLHGLGAVPVWFVSWPDLQAAIADGYLTVGELAGLPSHVAGSAGQYQESLHVGGVSNVGKIEFTANGTLEDGRSFQVQAMARDEVGRYMKVLITFR
jgi:hypothetical protein